MSNVFRGLCPYHVPAIINGAKKFIFYCEIVYLLGFIRIAQKKLGATDNKKQITNEFKRINLLFEEVKTNIINTLSIGMSNDYTLAINNGSTMIRLGSAIFGNRN